MVKPPFTQYISEQVSIYHKTNLVNSEKFSKIIQSAMNRYLNGMLANEEVIQELLKLAKEIAAAGMLLTHIYALVHASTWVRSQSVQADIPSPVLAETGKIFSRGLRIWAYSRTFSRSKSK